MIFITCNSLRDTSEAIITRNLLDRSLKKILWKWRASLKETNKKQNNNQYSRVIKMTKAEYQKVVPKNKLLKSKQQQVKERKLQQLQQKVMAEKRENEKQKQKQIQKK